MPILSQQIEGGTDREEVVKQYVEAILRPALQRYQIVWNLDWIAVPHSARVDDMERFRNLQNTLDAIKIPAHRSGDLPNETATDLASKSEALRLDLKNLYELGALVGIDELFELVDIGFTGFIHIDNVTGVVQG